jgi:alkylhydroperoxidase family enzyme
MKNNCPPKVQKAVEMLLNNPGESTPALRQAVEAYAASLSGASRKPSEIPDDLIDYVTKVSQHAYKTTDEDIERLKQAGYSEDSIFEITLSAAMGAGLARMERALDLLKGRQ